MTEHHIASAFDRDLEGIQANLMRMGGLVESAIQKATKALVDRDPELAVKVRADDKKIDALDETIHADCARLIALRQPIASDLRTILGVMRIVANLERIGDYAKNLAKRTVVLLELPEVPGASGSISRLAREVQGMLTDALEATLKQDTALAESVRHRDVEVDEMYVAFFRELVSFMLEDPRKITACMHYHFIGKNIERMGDHAVAVANQTIYQITGQMPAERREKGTENLSRPGGA
ncbi:MAG TPA: phosphate signaling complex protein PhoU, partial [Paracoccaceae bacterium]|nr:phosphate signaling complex protein PhoU [Paracoccaceae bacterium]